MIKERTCNNCGRVAFGVSLEYAEDQVMSFNKRFETLPEKSRELYGGTEATLEPYTRCIGCGGSYINFREAAEDDCPIGCTLSPILFET